MVGSLPLSGSLSLNIRLLFRRPVGLGLGRGSTETLLTEVFGDGTRDGWRGLLFDTGKNFIRAG